MRNETIALIFIIVLLCGWGLTILTLAPLGKKRNKPETVVTDWTQMATGDLTDKELEIAWLRAAQKMYTLFMQKNHDYGSQNIGATGLYGIVVRLGDKTSRLWNLLLGLKTPQVNENTEDTFMDLANYALIGYLITAKQWPVGNLDNTLGAEGRMQLIIDLYQKMTPAQRQEVDDGLSMVPMQEVLGGHIVVKDPEEL